MNVNLDKINELYGNEIILLMKENFEIIENNIKYLKEKGFIDVEDFIECYPYSFMLSEDVFCDKVDELFHRLGVEAVEKLQNDISLWGDLDDDL